MMKNLKYRMLLIMYFGLLSHFAYSDNFILWQQFLPQNEDSYPKYEYEYFELPETIPQQNVWDFSHIVATGKLVDVIWRNFGDSILLVIENDTQRTFRCLGDTIYQSAFESRFIRLTDSIAPVSLFPLSGQTTITTSYSETGYYSNLIPVHASGSQQLSFVAIGTLILPSDTLYNVYLVSQRRTGTIQVDKGNGYNRIEAVDSLLSINEEVCRWYAPGFRYPIVERINRTYGLRSLDLHNHKAVFVCLPEHNIRQQNVMPKQNNLVSGVIKGGEPLNFGKDILIRQSDSEIQIQLNSLSTYQGMIVLSDIHGRVWSYQAIKGQQTLSVGTSSLAAGNYILTLQVGDNIMSKRIKIE